MLKILQNILFLGIPAEIFDNTVEAMSDKKAQVDSKVSYFKFKSQFLRLFYAELYQIRDTMYNETNIQSTGAYEVSQEIGKLFQLIMVHQDSHYKEWCE